MRRLSRYIIIITGLLLCGPTVTLAQEDPLRMGVFPRREATKTIRMFSPLSVYLSKSLGRKVVLETDKDFQSFWSKVEAGYYDIVHYNQYHYVSTRNNPGYRVIAKNEEHGQSTIAGSLVIRKDSGIKHVRDLAGKKIVFGGSKKAMQSYIIATYLLRRGGLREGDYIETFAVSPPNAVLATYFYQASAAGVGDKVIRMSAVTQNANTNRLTYLARGRQLAHLPWAVNKRVSRNLRKRIQQVMTTLNQSSEGRRILRSAKLTNIVIAYDREYDQHRKIIRTVMGKQY